MPLLPAAMGICLSPWAARGAPFVAELQAEGRGIADAFLVPAGWEMAPLQRAPLFRGHVCCCSGVQPGGEKELRGTGRLGTEGAVACLGTAPRIM